MLELPLQALREGRTRTRMERRGISFETDAYIVDDNLIWGATARILEHLLEQLDPLLDGTSPSPPDGPTPKRPSDARRAAAATVRVAAPRGWRGDRLLPASRAAPISAGSQQALHRSARRPHPVRIGGISAQHRQAESRCERSPRPRSAPPRRATPRARCRPPRTARPAPCVSIACPTNDRRRGPCSACQRLLASRAREPSSQHAIVAPSSAPRSVPEPIGVADPALRARGLDLGAARLRARDDPRRVPVARRPPARVAGRGNHPQGSTVAPPRRAYPAGAPSPLSPQDPSRGRPLRQRDPRDLASEKGRGRDRPGPCQTTGTRLAAVPRLPRAPPERYG